MTFTRHQPELYTRIEEKVREKLINDIHKVKLSELEITADEIQTKAKIEIKPEDTVNVESFWPLLENKFGKIISKSNKLNIGINPVFEFLRNQIIKGGTSYHPKDNLNNLREIIETSYIHNIEQYNIEKDVYDFCLLKKIEGK
ncbi:hypothetical protein JXA48_04195 [Candidatus Woesearchaeota archaeon]|nr:hypothetical protein [Candidatus Woesearchaeota archaeon]